MDPNYAGTLQLVAKVVDAVTDPFIGVLSDRTRTRFGRRRIWMAGATIPCIIFFFLMWLGDPFETTAATLGFFFTVYTLQRISYTCYYVPYTALTMEVTASENQRNVLTQYRFIIGGIGQIGFILIMGQLVQTAASQENPYQPYRTATYIICALIAVSYVICCLFVPETTYRSIVEKEVNRMGPLQGMRYLVTNRPFMVLCAIGCLGWLALQLIQVNLLLYFVYVLQLRQQFTIGLVVGLLMIIPAVPIIRRIADRVGKKWTWFIGSLFIGAFALVSLLFISLLSSLSLSLFFQL